MKRRLIFKQTVFDSLPLDGRTNYSFFTESDESSESVTAMSEDQALNWLFQNPIFRRMFLEDFFESPDKVKSYFGLEQPFTSQNQKPGDIDLLLVNPDRPDLSIAFECKRVKAVSIDSENGKVNSIGNIRKGVIQANKYQSLGFHQSYLMIILLDDSREKKTPNTIIRRTKTEHLEQLYDIPWNEPLHQDVGIVFISATQPTGRDVNLNGGLGFCIDKPAKPLEQTAEMTNKIKGLLNKVS